MPAVQRGTATTDLEVAHLALDPARVAAPAAAHAVPATDLGQQRVAPAFNALTPELIQRVASGDWNEDIHEQDRQSRDAMAAHGYWLAHNEVKESIQKIFAGANAWDVLKSDHGAWFRAMFSPSVAAGILSPSNLAGYRGHQVYIRDAQHVPPPREAVREMMPMLFELLRDEPSAAVRAVLGHFTFVFIHPYMDGNGRLGRFIMNAMLASGGFPWTVLRLEDRSRYMEALDAANGQANIKSFATLVAQSLATAKHVQADSLHADSGGTHRESRL
jgi:hypothetical protein